MNNKKKKEWLFSNNTVGFVADCFRNELMHLV